MGTTFPKDIMDCMKRCILSIFWPKKVGCTSTELIPESEYKELHRADKWSASDSLYQFAAKVEGKMYGRGLFISVNGFSPDSVQALTTGRALRTILVDGGDLVPITEGMYTLKEMLDKKIKAAQTMGRIYVDSTNLDDKVVRQ